MDDLLMSLRAEAGSKDDAGAPEMSHENHFRFGYNEKCFNLRNSPADKWWVAYGRSKRPAMTWRDECIETARLIGRKVEVPIWLLFSGGIDSEVVIQSFMFAGVPFTVAITEFAHRLNQHDVQYAVQFCERHEIPYRKLRLDIVDFITSDAARDYASQTHCVQPQLLHTMWAMDQVDGFPVLGSGECLLVTEAPLDVPPGSAAGEQLRCVLYEKERIASWYRYLMVRGRDGCAGFFQYTPEVMLAFLEEDEVKKFAISNNILDDTTSFKSKIYRKHFLLQRRPKFHGFENVIHLDGLLRPELERMFGHWNQIYKTDYGRLIDEISPTWNETES